MCDPLFSFLFLKILFSEESPSEWHWNITSWMCFLFTFSRWSVYCADYCYCMLKDSGSSVLTQFILPPLLGIIHYHGVVLIQECYSEMKSCMGFLPIWTCQQRLTITAASYGLVTILYLKCKVLSCFTSQIIKWDFAFMLYWWRRVPKQSNVSNQWRFRKAY